MKRSWNPFVWWGSVLVLVGILSYPFFFAKFIVTRDFPWLNLLLIVLGLVLLAIGILRAFRRPDAYRGKIFASILAVIMLVFVASFSFEIFVMARRLPASQRAPQVGQVAPDFTLPDSRNNAVNLSALLGSPFSPSARAAGSAVAASAAGQGPTAGVLLIFYRGYW
jgi:hypothetical protein